MVVRLDLRSGTPRRTRRNKSTMVWMFAVWTLSAGIDILKQGEPVKFFNAVSLA